MALKDNKRQKSAAMLVGKTRSGVWSMAGRPVNHVTKVSYPNNLGRPRSLGFVLGPKTW